MKKIPLSQGKFALVDDEDYEFLMRRKWCAVKSKSGTFYAETGSIPPCKMHRLILNVNNPKILVDHKDGNGLNNQRSNIRICSSAQNLMNRGANSNCKSGFKGVAWIRASDKWQAVIGVDKKQIYLGMFDTKDEAARHYNAAAIKHHGPFAKLNDVIPLFPTVDRAVVNKNNSSGFRGVIFDSRTGKWAGVITVNRRSVHLGFHQDILNAAHAYNEAAIKYHGAKARLNPL